VRAPQPPSARHVPTPPASVFLADFTSPELSAAIAAGDTIALVYTGSTEGSGPHLALSKHNVRAPYYAERIARELGHTLVGQIVPLGVSPAELARYPATIALLGLSHPVPDRLSRGLELPGQLARCSPGADELYHLPLELGRIPLV
jgi:hypothetical protein